MKRSTMNTWVQVCPSCGYCAPELPTRIKNAKKTLSTEAYHEQLNDPDSPQLVNTFLCCSLLEDGAGEYGHAGCACLWAAWICDDATSDTKAQECREKALALWQKAEVEGQGFAEQPGAERALIVDLLRRTGQFERALKVCEDGLGQEMVDIISKIL